MINKHVDDENVSQEHTIQNAMQQGELLRMVMREEMNHENKSAFGQFFTPAPVAQLMASMFTCQEPVIRILDAGAGLGALFTAAVTEFCQREAPPEHILVTAYEIDDSLIEHIHRAMHDCEHICATHGIKFTGSIKHEDFIESGVALLSQANTLFSPSDDEEAAGFHCAILNPPYKKLQSDWLEKQRLQGIGIEASNLYVGFLALAMKLLAPGGELVAITPRSFCNGPYFKKFRRDFLHTMALQRLHMFESRTHTFKADEVLQENIIVYATKSQEPAEQVIITTSTAIEDDLFSTYTVNYQQVIHPNDPHSFIRIVQDSDGAQVDAAISHFHTTLADLHITVSTGRVVDFRAADYLRMEPEAATVPLLYALHLQHGVIRWPSPGSKKPNAIVDTYQTQSLLVPNEYYVLVKRFSSKEEKKRIVAVLYEPGQFPQPRVGFENHLNYFHQEGQGLDPILARGLVAYLNSSLVDAYFRQFNGHTQVNATDLRSITYPTRSQLEALGSQIKTQALSQAELDELIKKELLPMAESEEGSTHQLTQGKQKIAEALSIIEALGFLRSQQNERSALTLLALLDLKPDTPWSQAKNPLRGITPMMDFFREYYGKEYKPNTRETVRRQTVHQFFEVGLIQANPDQPDRPINSPKAVYQVEQGALALLRTFGTSEWDQALRTYLTSIETIQKRYAQERAMRRIPVEIAPGQSIALSPGGQNILVEKIMQDFAPIYTPGGKVLYIGDADEKFAYFDREGLAELGVILESHGKMPDVIIHYTKEDWLVLIEAVTSHGPIDWKRKEELERLFERAHAGLVLVTAFLTRNALLQFMSDIAWETEVWIAESPTHVLHFNGKRLSGPYK